MADLTEPEPEAVDPDLTDLAYVTINVETNAGQQFSMVLAAKDENLSMEQSHSDSESIEAWTFTITRSLTQNSSGT